MTLPIVILAAGEGKRLSEINPNLPKSIYPITKEQKSLLDYTLRLLLENPSVEIIIIGGYQFDALEQYLNSRYTEEKRKQIILVDSGSEWKKGPLYSLLSAQKVLERYKKFFEIR